MSLSLASSSDVARILPMTHIDFLDMATTSLILVDFQSNGAEILQVAKDLENKVLKIKKKPLKI